MCSCLLSHAIVAPCSNPAVAFRLLDFPSLLISWPLFDRQQVGQTVQGNHRVSHLSMSEFSMASMLIGLVDFNRGKSCLMKLSRPCLDAIFTKVPLYRLTRVQKESPALPPSKNLELRGLRYGMLVDLSIQSEKKEEVYLPTAQTKAKLLGTTVGLALGAVSSTPDA